MNCVPVIQTPRAVSGKVVRVDLIRRTIGVLRVAVVEGAVLLRQIDKLMQGVVEVVEEQLKEALGRQAYDVGHVQDLERYLRVTFHVKHLTQQKHETIHISINFEFTVQLHLP